MRTTYISFAIALAFAACGDPPREQLLAYGTLGATGGVIEGEGITLEVPAGALGDDTTISISVAETQLQPQYAALSRVFHFEPDGLEFQLPVAVRIAATGAASGAVLWSTPAGDGREWAGFVEDGIGYGQTLHFSEGAAASEFGACSADSDACDEECDSVEDVCEGDACPAIEGATCSVSLERCRDICWCESDDRHDKLCAFDPKDPRKQCPATNPQIGTIYANGSYERPSAGNEFLARRTGEACQGYAIRPLEMNACFCEATFPGPPGVPLCPNGRWVNKAAPPNYNWACESDIDGQQPGILRNDRIYEDLATRAFTGVDGGACSGQYVESNNTISGSNGKLKNCTKLIVAHGYVQLSGTAASCGRFGWPGPPPSTVQIDRAQCRLSDAHASRLATRRSQLNLPARSWNPNDGVTLALLDVDGETLTGINSRNRTERFYSGCRGVGARTPLHAEGDVLEQLAVYRMVTPVTESPWGSTGGINRGGNATLLVDRAPCARHCAGYGIERFRHCAGVEQLDVHSPSGTVRYCDTCGLRGIRLEP